MSPTAAVEIGHIEESSPPCTSSTKSSFELDKKAASDGTVKLLIERLLSYLPK
jgi:hypothetical protein